MTQAISVYISKTIFGLVMIWNLEQQKYITIWNKTTTAQNTWCQSFVPTYSREPVVNLILYMMTVYRSELRSVLRDWWTRTIYLFIYLYITLHVTNWWLHFIIFGLVMIWNLEQQKYIIIWNKTTTTQNTWYQSFVPTYSEVSAVNLILYTKTVYRSELRDWWTRTIYLFIYLYITLHFTNWWLHFTGILGKQLFYISLH